MRTIEASARRAHVRALPRLSRRTGFWAIAFSFLALTAFSTAPSSLYGLYQRDEHLSGLTLTLVYAVYAVGIVVSLLLAGHVSDWYGRRTVLLPALAVAVVAAVVFLVWRSLAGLVVARVLTGLALGAAVATATTFITDLDAGPEGVATSRAGIVATIANIGGLAVGALIAGLLARYAAHPLTLPFVVLLAALVAAVVLVTLAPEGSPALRPRPRYHPQRLAAPANARRQFVAAATGLGGLCDLRCRRARADYDHELACPPPGPAGIAPMIVGLCLLVPSAWTSPPSLALFLISGVVAGVGIGAIIRGSLTVVISTSDPDDRAGPLATFFTAGYAGVSLPVVGIGLALQHLSFRITLLVFGVAVGVGILAAAPILVRPTPEPVPPTVPDSDPMTALCSCFGARIGAPDAVTEGASHRVPG